MTSAAPRPPAESSGRRLGRNAAMLAMGQGGRTLLQLGYFVLLTHALGVAQYGAFWAGMALASMLVPLSGLGVVILLIRNITRAPERAAQEWATARRVVLVTGGALTAVAAVGVSLIGIPGLSVGAVVAFGVADLVAARLVEAASATLQALGLIGRTALYPVYLSAVRLGGGLVLAESVHRSTVEQWALLYAATSVVLAAVVLLRIRGEVGKAQPQFRDFLRTDARDGLQYSIGLSSQGVYNDIDKAMLARLSTATATGIYVAAYRVVDMAMLPFKSLLLASSPQMFDVGQGGLRATLRFTRSKLVKPALGYTGIVSLGLAVFAPVVPYVLGEEYHDVVGALRGLAVLPLLKAVHYLAADTLTGCGLHGPRTITQVVVAVANIGLNLWLISAYSWQGAVVASVLSDGALAVSLWGIVWFQLRRLDRSPSSAAA